MIALLSVRRKTRLGNHVKRTLRIQQQISRRAHDVKFLVMRKKIEEIWFNFNVGSTWLNQVDQEIKKFSKSIPPLFRNTPVSDQTEHVSSLHLIYMPIVSSTRSENHTTCHPSSFEVWTRRGQSILSASTSVVFNVIDNIDKLNLVLRCCFKDKDQVFVLHIMHARIWCTGKV